MIGKIYFVSAPGRIKIGYTRKPEQRLAQLKAVDMEPLTSLGVIPGTRSLEKRLHALVAPHRIRGEWFADCEPVRMVIGDALNGLHPCEEEPPELSIDRSLLDSRNAVLRAASAETKALLDEIERRMRNRENVSDLVRAACFLGESVIAPMLGAPVGAEG